MREIKFRGKRIDNDDWVYGHYTEGQVGYHYITNNNGAVWQVDPKTVGMFTGKNDRLGNELYENDITEFYAAEWGNNKTNKHLITWDKGNASWDWGGGASSDFEFRTLIGNKHDNPDLLNQ